MAPGGQAELARFGAGHPERQSSLLEYGTTHSQRRLGADAWQPPSDATACGRCGNTDVSHAFVRQWADNDGVLRGCRECLPRSVRFGEDVYGRDPDDVDGFDLDAPNKGRDPAPSTQQVPMDERGNT